MIETLKSFDSFSEAISKKTRLLNAKIDVEKAYSAHQTARPSPPVVIISLCDAFGYMAEARWPSALVDRIFARRDY